MNDSWINLMLEQILKKSNALRLLQKSPFWVMIFQQATKYGAFKAEIGEEKLRTERGVQEGVESECVHTSGFLLYMCNCYFTAHPLQTVTGYWNEHKSGNTVYTINSASDEISQYFISMWYVENLSGDVFRDRCS